MTTRVEIFALIRQRIIREVRFGMRNVDFEIPMVEGDTGPLIEFRLIDKKGVPVDLTDKEVNFYIRRADEEYSPETQNPACTVIEAVSGIVEYGFGAGDLVGPGTYFGELQVLGERLESAPDPIRFIVRPRATRQGS